MNIISENPYRTLGIFCGASTRDIQKQLAMVKAFSRVGKQSKLETDFEFLGGVNRDIDLVTEAANKIEQAKNKVVYALFWFQKANHIDETAIRYLLNNETQKAVEIWSKIIETSNNVVTSKNFSAYLNLSTLLVELGYQTQDKMSVSSGFQLKGTILSSEHFNEFVKCVGGENIVLNREVIAEEIVTEMLNTIKNGSVDLSFTDIIESFKTFPPKVLGTLKKKYTEQPILSIEREIELSKESREENPEKANEYGIDLYKRTKQNLQFLIQTLGKTNIEMKTLANSLANEILQCSIDYFNNHREDSDFDPGEEAVKLAKMAKSICPQGATLNRINENLETIQEWVDEAPSRQLHNKVKSELSFITEKLSKFQKLPDTISHAKDLVNSCLPHLNEMKLKLGQGNELYISISSAVAGNAQGMIISSVNEAMERRTSYVKYYNYRMDPSNILRNTDFGYSGGLLDSYRRQLEVPPAPVYTIEQLKDVISSAWSVTVSLGNLDMDSKQRQNFEKNKEALKSIAGQLDINTMKAVVFDGVKNVSQRVMSSNNRSSKSSSGGCYIATMAYGSYEHPKVIVLRNYRDKVLLKKSTGRFIVTAYYVISPKLVALLKNNTLINNWLRVFLDAIIVKIQK